MKILANVSILISLLILSMGVSYFFYYRNHLPGQPVLTPNNISVEPAEGDALQPPKQSTTSPTDSSEAMVLPAPSLLPTEATPAASSSPLTKLITEEYATAYQAVGNNFNKVSASIESVSGILIETGQAYAKSDQGSLNQLILSGKQENSNLYQNIKIFKSSLDNLNIVNKQIVADSIKGNTSQVVDAGQNYSKSSLDFYNAAGSILDFKGVGDITQLVQRYSGIAQVINNAGVIFQQSFSKLSNLLR